MVPGGRGGRLGPFRHRSYQVYWVGVAITSLGTWLSAVAGSIYVYQLTGSTLSVGVFNAASFLPILLFSVWAARSPIGSTAGPWSCGPTPCPS